MLPTVMISKAFAFYDPLNLLALELGFVLKSEQREAFWSLTLICESITVQFQTFVLHLKQILLRKMLRRPGQ